MQSGSYVFTDTQHELGVKPVIHVSHMVKHVRACTKLTALIAVMQQSLEGGTGFLIVSRNHALPHAVQLLSLLKTVSS